ncbi:uncharacterized protein K452DRAFT_262114 [Aplosporella prunicola CBS 121167]|uniref:Uncharacterized protein n=1 Tax=Aplosporella prunicola CBS 121167 TaxID=1176127 RepID=A0A6A6BXG4_9PEZI|nr:uncharacterized protein K452DRAFT_262114 [Aplosporella prunicola CBS 121167]KAF2147544.1 hypothetical protein K452DRAFT_262114 [Aplosporella prunicola CBS 121167]
MSACVACQNPLLLELDESDDEHDVCIGGSSSSAAAPKTVPDDVHLNCGCHFHWYCLLDAYTVPECSNCSANLCSVAPDGGQQVLCHINNEGGQQENVDILPLLSEEGYLKANPEERKCRAFLEFCREGDVGAVVAMLQDDDDDEDEDDDDDDEHEHDQHMHERREIDVLRYQDPIGDMQSGLHAAVAGASREAAWLLLLLASNLDLSEFPAQVFQEAEALGIMRGDQTGKADIRTLRDASGMTAADLAHEMGGVWVGWPQRLSV